MDASRISRLSLFSVETGGGGTVPPPPPFPHPIRVRDKPDKIIDKRRQKVYLRINQLFAFIASSFSSFLYIYISHIAYIYIKFFLRSTDNFSVNMSVD